ncbi:sulfhydryl oxidase 1-like [Mytilus galloprovincialis]|uniref:sulfhydryl oxidase 1-like n=1 Tax=Mytilus galloprovincialis TaxID=29158 RepID=UPI003F7B8BE9
MFVFLWILLTLKCTICLGDEGLYKSSDNVVILTNDSFYPAVLGSENAWIIEFYNSWCGHCINFAPKWKEFATNTKGWQKVISIGAVDCSQNNNIPLCRNYDIQGYPAIIFFPPHADEAYRGEPIHDQDTDSIGRRVINYIGQFVGDSKPQSWPALQPLSAVEQIWEESKDIHKHVILLFEHEESYIGRQVILDLCQYKHLLIRTVTNQNIVKFGVTHLPSLFLLHGDGRFEHIAKGVDDRETIVAIIKKLIGADQDNNEEKLEGPKMAEQTVKNKMHTKAITNGTVVYMSDLESALSYSFRQEIAIQKSIDGKALQALKDFIRVLTKYFPGEDYLKKFLLRIKTWIDTVSSGLTGEVWVYYIDSLQSVDTYLPEKISWIGCKGSESRYRGYPCSMWTLFHTLTANAYIIGKNSPKFLYAEVINAITDYMKYFFGCKECVNNFLKMADKRQISSASDQVLWLWNAHNKANKRLHGDQSEDPLHPKIMFPSERVCPKCRKGIEKDDSNREWDKNEVLKFIVKMYDKENIVKNSSAFNTKSDVKKSRVDLDWWERMQRSKDLEKIKDIRQMKRQKLEDKIKMSGNHLPVSKKLANSKYQVEEKLKYPSGLSRGDMNMCVMFYGLCIAIIGVLYYHFVRRRKMNPCNGCSNP